MMFVLGESGTRIGLFTIRLQRNSLFYNPMTICAERLQAMNFWKEYIVILTKNLQIV